MSRLLHRIFIGVEEAPVLTDPPETFYILFENSDRVLFEDNNNLIDER